MSSLFNILKKKSILKILTTQLNNFERRLCAQTQDIQIFKKFYMSEMNTKEQVHTTAFSVQLPYIAGHSLKSPRLQWPQNTTKFCSVNRSTLLNKRFHKLLVNHLLCKNIKYYNYYIVCLFHSFLRLNPKWVIHRKNLSNVVFTIFQWVFNRFFCENK